MHTIQTYECDECGRVQSVDPREFVKMHLTEDILAVEYGWDVVRAAGYPTYASSTRSEAGARRYSRGVHLCPKCRK